MAGTKRISAKNLVELTRNGDRHAAAKLITLLERGHQGARKAITKLGGREKETLVIGITGPGGVGKSTLINRLIKTFRQDGFGVGVLTMDPVSSLSGGAVLGDRVRMQEHCADKQVFIRSFAMRSHCHGVIQATPLIIKALELLGIRVVIIETIGVGQEDTGIKNAVDKLVLVLMPGLGDGIQFMKAGVLEVADVIVLNKSDLPGTEAAFVELSFSAHPKIIKVNSITAEGIIDLKSALQR